MFNNIKYKVGEEIVDPIVKVEAGFTESVTSELRSSLEEVGGECGVDSHNMPACFTNIKEVLSFYKPLTIIGKIIYFPYLIKTLIINIKSLYNGQ